MSPDEGLRRRLRNAVPDGWCMSEALDLDSLGGYHAVAQHRFIFLDLDATEEFDPFEIIRVIRLEWSLPIGIFCCGGHSVAQEAARRCRVTRCFDRSEAADQLRIVCHEYRWGG